MSKPLFELTSDMHQILEQIEETGEIPEDLEIQLDKINANIGQKIDGCLAWLENLEGERRSLEAPAKKFGKRLTAIKKKIGWVKDYIKCNMERLSIIDFNGDVLGAKIYENSAASLRVTDPKALMTHIKDKFDVKELKSFVLERGDASFEKFGFQVTVHPIPDMHKKSAFFLLQKGTHLRTRPTKKGQPKPPRKKK